ncbi:L-seryl-tRNA(Sec) selenium transferase [Streptomyces griseomycini]|uniref:L-seryl-tRNA(Sec) selenium transferase n=1 Tax=Streptomyces griseomycini TaxID=66895 RepID=A0A7W7PUD7_9ACTN|nr:L-seryl-tRNA(Ser) seleniumtransferase [Streptomyces griseomycini]GGQ14999.1 L-seryl-tRNA(Sec) selenium transferase [Streptomyces griseomycini]GGR25094.1 L-seryl-tRNA(Sec) selenium transferase [Streptomyces griseomycini]
MDQWVTTERSGGRTGDGAPGEAGNAPREPGPDARRRIPRTDAVLRDPRLREAARRLGADAVKSAVHRAQERARDGAVEPEAVADTAVALLPRSASGLRPVINATGVLLHTNLGRASLSAAARRAVQEAAGPTDVELDLHTGVRARRGRTALAALRERVPSAAAAHVVNNGAAALVLAATALAAGREIVVSRGEMVEIGDGFRLPDLLVSTGARLREVGTTNRTTAADYAGAIGPDTAFVLKVHPSNFRITGFTRAAEVGELAPLGVPVVVDIGSGLLAPHPLLPEEPDAESRLRAGAALVTASGDKLLGGPQCGLLLGREETVRTLSRHPLARALRVDKLTLAALEATLTGPGTPTGEALAADPASLLRRAERLAALLGADGIDVRAVGSSATVGGGGAPGVTLPSAALSLPERWAAALRTGPVPVVGRLEAGRCLLDLRAVPERDDERLAGAVRSAAGR